MLGRTLDPSKNAHNINVILRRTTKMICYLCSGTMKQVKKDVESNWKGRTVVFKGLEPWVCENCGEEAYEPVDVDIMQSLIRGTSAAEPLPEVMNIEEVADLLRVSTQTIYTLARLGKLPATKIGREWRFSRNKVLELLNSNTSGEESVSSQMVALAARNLNSQISSRDKAAIMKHVTEM
jgi:excisionase family DNA binding protein/YgiT-type zinc finger domain-containing protein